MKKRIFPVLIVVILSALVMFVTTQISNIKGILYAINYDAEQIEEMIIKADVQLQEDISKVIGHTIREFTEEENKQIKEGIVTQEEVVEKIVREQAKESEKSNKPDVVSIYITELYNLKSSYIGKLDAMVASAVAEYKSLPKEKRTRSKQIEIGASYVTKAMSLEAECDSKVNDVVAKIEAQLKSEGKSPELAKTIKKSYASEKELKRAYYLNMFK